jgi:hypothetical protein
MNSLAFRRLIVLVIFSLTINIFLFAITAQQSQAAVLTNASMVLYRMGANNAATVNDPILIIMKTPTAVAASSQAKISFAPGFSVNNTVIATTAPIVGTIALPMTVQNMVVQQWPLVKNSSISVSVTDVSFTSGALVAGSIYGFFITAGVTNPSITTGNPYVSTLATYDGTGVTQKDTSRVATSITSSSGDQVVVTASVPPTFSFSIPASSTIALGDLSTSVTKNGSVVATISTNANNGYVTWVKGSAGNDSIKAALNSASISQTILSQGTPGGGTCTTYTPGTEYYQISATYTHPGGNGTITKNPSYDCGISFTSGGSIGKYYHEVMRSSGTASSDTVTLNAMAAANNLSQAATDYTDTWTVIGAANF